MSLYHTNNSIEKRFKRIVYLFKNNTQSTLIFGHRTITEHTFAQNVQISLSVNHSETGYKGSFADVFMFSVDLSYGPYVVR